jgi:hypothetical protein
VKEFTISISMLFHLLQRLTGVDVTAENRGAAIVGPQAATLFQPAIR